MGQPAQPTKRAGDRGRQSSNKQPKRGVRLLAHLLRGGVDVAVLDVVEDGLIEEDGVLRDHTHLPTHLTPTIQLQHETGISIEML